MTRAHFPGVLALAILLTSARAGSAAPALAAVVAADDSAIAIGPQGQVYAPDGHGAWLRSEPITIAADLTNAATAGDTVFVLGGGAVYRRTPTGWTTVRLAQRGTAVMNDGGHAIAAIGSQLFDLGRMTGGEAAKLARAPAAVLGIGTGAGGVVIATERGLFRRERGGFVALPRRLPQRVDRLISDRWALVARAALDLRRGRTVDWPRDVTVQVAAAGTGDALVAIGSTPAGLDLLTLEGTKLTRDPIAGTSGGVAVGVVVAKAGIIVGLRDGRLAIRRDGRWTVVDVRLALPAPRPGPGPAQAR